MGVLGCSNHFTRVAASLKASALVESYAVASRDGTKARDYAEKNGLSRFYGSYRELLADTLVDFVYIPLPNQLHLEYIKKSADAGKPVICEKPLCLNADEAAEAAAYCRERNVPLMEAFMYRFHPQWLRAREIAASGEIGEILTVHGHFSYDNRDGGNIRNRVDCGGGALYDIGCYTVSSARFLFGREPERALCTLARDPLFKTDILTSGILDFGGGRSATFTVSTQMYPRQYVSAVGSGGPAGGGFTVELPFNMPANVPVRITLNSGGAEQIIETECAGQYLLEYDAFAESLLTKTEVPSPVSDAIANMAVLDALFKSAESGVWEPVKKY
jgi:predicted dehydrogenase